MDVTFVSSLGPDEVFEVFRRLSPHPCEEGGLRHVPNSALKLLVDDTGPFAHSLANKFQSLSVATFGWNMDSLLIPADPITFKKALRLFGGSLTRIVMQDDTYSDEFLACFSTELNERCVALKSLSVPTSLNWKDVAVKHLASLEELHIRACSSQKNFLFPSTPLPALRKLSLRVLGQENGTQDANELASFLASSGGKLEVVDIVCKDDNVTGWLAVIDALRTICRNVRKITLYSDDYGGSIPQVDEMKKLLISYGSQLRKTDLFCFPSAMCEEILAQCPNVLCDWPYKYRADAHPGEILDKFEVLAPRIEDISIAGSFYQWLYSASERAQFEASLSKLVNLKSYDVGYDPRTADGPRNSVYVTNLVFSEPKLFLLELSLIVPVVNRELSLSISKSCYLLQSLEVLVNEVKGDELSLLFEGCRDVEEARFAIRNAISANDAFDQVKDLILIAWKKAVLRELIIVFHEAYRNWDRGVKEKFQKDVNFVAQRLRLRRCVVRIEYH